MGRALDMILTGRIVEADEALAMGLLTEVVPPGKHLERSLEMAEGLASFPQETMLADRRSAIEGFGLPLEEGLAREAEIGGAVTRRRRRGRRPLRRRRGPRRQGRRRLGPQTCRHLARRLRHRPLLDDSGVHRHLSGPQLGPLPVYHRMKRLDHVLGSYATWA